MALHGQSVGEIKKYIFVYHHMLAVRGRNEASLKELGTVRLYSKGSFRLAANQPQPATVAVKIEIFPIICRNLALCDSCCNLGRLV